MGISRSRCRAAGTLLLWVTAVTGLGVAVGLDPAEAADTKGPLLVVDDPVFDWGTAFQGEQFERSFVLHNKGQAALTIKELKPECGCTVAQKNLENKTLKPGESAKVTLKVDTSKFKNSFERKGTDIICVGEVPGDRKIWMQGFVKRLLTFNPSEPRLEVILDDDALAKAELKLYLNNNLETPIRVKSLKPTKGLLAVDLSETKKGSVFQAVLKPTLDPKDRTAFHKESLSAVVEVGAREIVLGVDVSISAHSRIQVSPSKSVWFPRKVTQDIEKPGTALPAKTLEIKSVAGSRHSFRIKGVKVEKKSFHTTLETVQPGRLYRLKVELLRPEKTGKRRRLVRDKIIIETDDPRVPEIRVPATAQI